MIAIKNLLFDLGGVIMDIKKERCVEAFEKLGLKNASRYFGDFSQNGVFLSLERGDITVRQFHDALRADLPAGVTEEQIDDAFCKFLIGIPVHRLRALRSLARSYNIALLSNTNPIMWDRTIRQEFEKEGLTRADYFPAGMVTSFEANSLKPEPKIFRYTTEKLGLIPSETLFLDDSQANLDAAAKEGFHTALVPTDSEFTDVLASLSIRP